MASSELFWKSLGAAMKRRATTFCIVFLGVLISLWWVSRDKDKDQTQSIPIEVMEIESISIHENNPTQAASETTEPQISESSEYYERQTPYRNKIVNPVVLMSDLRLVFDQHYTKSQEGDPESLFVISQVVENCSLVDRIYTVEQLEGYIAAGMLSEEIFPSAVSLIPDCRYVQSQKPEKLLIVEWMYELRKSAAKKGHTMAQLRIAQYLPKSEQNFFTLSRLLEKAVKTQDYRAYYQASRFYQKYMDFTWDGVDAEITKNTWDYLGCMEHSECDEAIMLQNLKTDLLPYQVESVVVNAKRLKAEIPNRDSFGFGEFRSQEELRRMNNGTSWK